VTHRPTVRAVNGVVACGHHLAAAAGVAALRDGGTAADAAVAAAAVCAVVLPHRTSIGGDVFALVHDAGARAVRAYNGSGAAPRAATPEALAAGRRGAALATIPGCVAAWSDILEAHGRLGLDRALSPAIAYADQGFAVSEVLAGAIAAEAARLEADPDCARAYLPRGRRPRPGEILPQPELADSLRVIAAQGPRAFYRGDLAQRLVSGIARSGGLIDGEDLAAHSTDRPEPLALTYGGLRVFGQPPVSQGHILLEELAIAADLQLGQQPWGSAELVHAMVEIKKLAFADRDAYAGDPRVMEFDASRLLDPDFAAARRRAIPARATDRPEAGSLAVPAHTTYLAVADRDGNVVSLIESVFSAFGAAAMVPGTGILLNDRMNGFSSEPGSPNALAPGKRPVHTLNTVLALEGSTPRLAFGTPGRHAQVQTNFQLAVALIDHRMGVQEAIEEPRWYHQSGRALHLEARFPENVRRALAAKGHEIVLLPEWAETTGGAQAVSVDENGVFAAGADPRREGYALGY
jgi:gamma-glutamyltranspeptidase